MRGYVCCMGSINVDVTLRLDRVPDRHEKLPAREAAICGGGSASNTTIWLSRQGVSVRHGFHCLAAKHPRIWG